MKLQATHSQCSLCSLWLIMLESGSSKTRRTVENPRRVWPNWPPPCPGRIPTACVECVPLGFTCQALVGWIITRERQRPRWLRSACLSAEKDLGVPEKGAAARHHGRGVLCVARALLAAHFPVLRSAWPKYQPRPAGNHFQTPSPARFLPLQIFQESS